MGTAEIGIAFQAWKPPGRYGELAAAAEAYGFDVVSVFADLLDQPPLPALLEMARATSRVRLGAACLNPYTQHPYEIAGGLAALDATSGGRAYLGLARGAWLEAIGIEQHHPLDHLRDTAAIVRALLSGDDAGYAAPRTGWRPGSGCGTRFRAELPPLLLGRRSCRGYADQVEIVVDDLTGPQIASFLDEHVREMLSITPPESQACPGPRDAARTGDHVLVGHGRRHRGRLRGAEAAGRAARRGQVDADPGGPPAQRDRVDDAAAHHHRGQADRVQPAEPGDRFGRVLRARPAAVPEVRVRVLRAVRRLPARPAERVPDQDAVRGGMRVGRWPPKA